MTTQELLNRRRFLARCTGHALGVSAMSALGDLRLMGAALPSTLSDYKALICIFLNGGHDAGNFIVPRSGQSFDDYVSQRGGLMNYDALTAGTTGGLALPLDRIQRANGNVNQLPYSVPIALDENPYGFDFGLNAYAANLKSSVVGGVVQSDDGTPQTGGIKTLWDEGKVACLANVGTLVEPINRTKYKNGQGKRPPQLYSHNDQVYQWQTSIPDQPSRTGWAGRMADLLSQAPYNAVGDTTNKVSISISLSGTNTIEVGDIVAQYQLTTSGAVALTAASTASRRQAILDVLRQPGRTNYHERDFADVADRAISNAALITDALSAAETGAGGFVPGTTPPPGGSAVAFPNTGLGNQMKMIARLINATRPNHPNRLASGSSFLQHRRQIYFCSIGGFDTHLGQPRGQIGLHTEMSNAIYAFVRSMEAMGVSEKVASFTISDFGRTFKNNALGANAGSDHGWGSHHFIFGGGVRGRRIFGQFPSLLINGPDDTSDGRWIPTTSVDEYSATLAKWFGVPTGDLYNIFPNLHKFPSTDLGFMA